MNSFTLSLSRLTELFDKFNEKANKGEMQKLPYNMWKSMRKYISWANAQEIKCDVKIEHETWKGNEKLTFRFSPEFTVTIPFQPGEKPSFFAMILSELYEKFLAKFDTDTINGFSDDAFSVTLAPDTVLSAGTAISSKYPEKSYSLDLDVGDFNVATLTDYCKYLSDNYNDLMTTAISTKADSSSIDGDYYPNRISDLSTTDTTSYYWNTDTKTTPLISPAKVAGTPLTTYNDSATKAGLYIDGEEICDKIKRVAEEVYDMKTTIFNKENKTTMKNLINFDFGPVGENIHMSPYGMAIKNADGVYVSYNKTTGQIMDVDVLNFTGMNKFMYKVPVAVSAVAVGDVVIHQKVPMFVTAINNSTVSVVDIFRGEHKTIMPTVSPFNFNFITKIVSLFDMNNMGASSENPFGNLWPLMMAQSDDIDISDIMLMTMMMNGNTDNNMNMFVNNPMMMYFLMGEKGKNNDIFPLMMMMNGCSVNTSTKVTPKMVQGGTN